jgi:hypothetical protein
LGAKLDYVGLLCTVHFFEEKISGVADTWCLR